MMKSKIGPVTAYADAVAAGYTGTREEFGRQQADFAKNAASVEQAKTEVNQAIELFGQTANVAKEDVIAEGDRQVQRIEDIAPDLSLDREQIASNTAGVEEAKAAAEEAKTIAKGRATGYVFDTAEDMETWLASEENIKNLVLGDNLYIRATDVPDYWWDGTQAHPLETQKVDMQEYVKFTDYASNNDYGVVRTPNKYGNGIEIENGNLKLYMADNNAIYNKQPVNIRRAIGAGHMDLISVQSAHQEMSNDYDPSTALTPDGGVPYAYGDRQPVSYAAVKKYIDDTYGETWKDTPVLTITVEEECAYIDINEINGEAFAFERLGGYALIPSNTGSDVRLCIILNGIGEASYNGLVCMNTNGAKEKTQKGVFEVKKEFGMWHTADISTQVSSWLDVSGTKHEHWDSRGMFANVDAITSFRLIPYSGVFNPGGTIKIYGKPARKGATT